MAGEEVIRRSGVGGRTCGPGVGLEDADQPVATDLRIPGVGDMQRDLDGALLELARAPADRAAVESALARVQGEVRFIRVAWQRERHGELTAAISGRPPSHDTGRQRSPKR